MDIFNRPPSISEDTLHYALYPPQQSSDKASVISLAAHIREYVDGLICNFIWHRDAFELKAAEDHDSKTCFLEGRMRVGDSVDDEWCTVWLLREISSKWDLVIKVCDTDGEFILIEAAEELPSWVKPSNAENRVWIYNSRLHLIPLTHISPLSRKQSHKKYVDNAASGEEYADEEDDEYLASEDAVKLVRNDNVNTLAPEKVEATVWKRFSGYPRKLREHIHIAKGYVPLDIAKALLANPLLVQKAVEAFYTRDAIQLRAAHRMSRFPPGTNILRSVKMTRTAYAQLVSQKFYPPRIFGQWTESEGSKEYKWKDIGMKIAVGFEMLYQESKGQPTAKEAAAEKSKAEANKDALRRNTDYIQYIQHLVSNGYFKGQKEGSELWNDLETKAADVFIDIRSPSQRSSFAKQVEIAVSEAASIGDPGLQEEDDESWLTVDAEDFETKLEKTMGRGSQTGENDAMDIDSPEISKEDRIASEQAARLKVLASRVEQFVEGEGDIDGARFTDEEFSDELSSDDSDMEDSDMEPSKSWPSDYAHDSASRKEAMDQLVPGLEANDYGKMPASYHSTSQKVAPITIATDVVEDNTLNQSGSPKKSSGTSGKPIRAPILSRDKYEGVDSDDESDEEAMDDESEEDMPQVVGDIEIDMGEEEEEFLEFSRQALGISDAQWNEIIQDRKGRGAFIPKSTKKAKATASEVFSAQNPSKTEHGEIKADQQQARAFQSGSESNPELNSFEAVMNAMDAELSRLRTLTKLANRESHPEVQPQTQSSQSTTGKGKAKVHFMEEENIEAAMEAELKAALEREEDDESGNEDEPMDYTLIKNFLESFKSQAGLSGPVSNLAGGLQPGFQFPRDNSM